MIMQGLEITDKPRDTREGPSLEPSQGAQEQAAINKVGLGLLENPVPPWTTYLQKGSFFLTLMSTQPRCMMTSQIRHTAVPPPPFLPFTPPRPW